MRNSVFHFSVLLLLFSCNNNTEKDVADKYYVELEDLMNYNLSFMMNGMFDDEEEFEEEED